MATFDIFAIAILVVGLLIGLWTRIAWQLFWFVSMLVAYAVSLFANPYLVQQVGEGWEWADRGMMFVSVLAVMTLLGLLLSYFAGGISRIKPKKWARRGGALFGLINAAFICLLVASFLVCFSPQGRKAVSDSQFGRGAAWTVQYVPKAILPNWWANYEVFKDKQAAEPS